MIPISPPAVSINRYRKVLTPVAHAAEVEYQSISGPGRIYPTRGRTQPTFRRRANFRDLGACSGRCEYAGGNPIDPASASAYSPRMDAPIPRVRLRLVFVGPAMGCMTVFLALPLVEGRTQVDQGPREEVTICTLAQLCTQHCPSNTCYSSSFSRTVEQGRASDRVPRGITSGSPPRSPGRSGRTPGRRPPTVASTPGPSRRTRSAPSPPLP